MSNPFGPELKRSKYRILGLVGQGQFGRVYCAVHRQSGRLVALKNLEHQRFPTHKFLRELRFLLSLQHPNIVTCKALEHTSTGRYLVMDYCEGGTLRSLMESDLHLNLTQGVKLVTDLLAGLAHAHARGIVHCDIKPENILLSVQPQGWVARISDFGIAKLSQEMGVQDTGNTGSPAYMAPERFYGQYFQSSDLYSVGIILFELLAGHRPFSGTPVDLMSAHLNRPVQIPDTIAEHWHPILRTALQKLPARRFKSALEMLSALKQADATGGTSGCSSSDAVLLAPAYVSDPCPFVAQYQQSLTQPVTQMVMVDSHRAPSLLNGLYRGAATTIRLYSTEQANGWLESAVPDWTLEHRLNLEDRVLELIPRPQGCFAITPTALHHLTIPTNPSQAITASPLATYSAPAHVAIEPGGRWWAILEGGQEGFTLRLQQGAPSAIAPLAVPHAPIELRGHKSFPYPHRLLIPDGRHLLVLWHSSPALPSDPAAESTTPIPSTGADGGTLVQLYTRRGDRLGQFTIPVQLQQVILTPTPYRLLATEGGNSRSVLVIDLKPYRVNRLAVDVCARHLVATPWGYLVADAAGRIVVLNDLGQWIGEIAGPPQPTAIASFQQRGLMVATWGQDQGMFYMVDLQRLDLDLMF